MDQKSMDQLKRKRQEAFDRWKRCWGLPSRHRIEEYEKLNFIDELIAIFK